MIAALLLGRKGSIGFPNKNLYKILGHPLAWYVMDGAKKSKYIDKIYLSTNDERLMDIAYENEVEVIKRPEYLCDKEALGEDAYVHGYNEICDRIGEKPELLVLLFCNAVTFLPSQIDEGIEVLRNNSEYDSAITVSRYNMYSPLRARRIGEDGLLHPCVSFDSFSCDQKDLNCDRDSQGNVWFADVSISVVRPSNLENIDEGLLPQKWMGQKIYPIEQSGGMDVDYEWQIPQVEWWITNHLIGGKKFYL